MQHRTRSTSSDGFGCLFGVVWLLIFALNIAIVAAVLYLIYFAIVSFS